MGVAEAQKFVHTLRSTFNALEVLIVFVWRGAVVEKPLPFSFSFAFSVIRSLLDCY